jgi:hypothetical protein
MEVEMCIMPVAAHFLVKSIFKKKSSIMEKTEFHLVELSWIAVSGFVWLGSFSGMALLPSNLVLKFFSSLHWRMYYGGYQWDFAYAKFLVLFFPPSHFWVSSISSLKDVESDPKQEAFSDKIDDMAQKQWRQCSTMSLILRASLGH